VGSENGHDSGLPAQVSEENIVHVGVSGAVKRP
jgi:hypothetical protein